MGNVPQPFWHMMPHTRPLSTCPGVSAWTAKKDAFGKQASRHAGKQASRQAGMQIPYHCPWAKLHPFLARTVWSRSPLLKGLTSGGYFDGIRLMFWLDNIVWGWGGPLAGALLFLLVCCNQCRCACEEKTVAPFLDGTYI